MTKWPGRFNTYNKLEEIIMMKIGQKQTQVVKLNEALEVEVVTFNNRFWRVRGLNNGQVVHVEHKVTDLELDEIIRQVAVEVLADELDKDYYVVTEVEGQLYIESDVYRIWVALTYDNGKFTYGLSTVRYDDEDEGADRNTVERKTWKGLTNYINRFA